MPPNPSHPCQAYANPINSTLKWPVSNNLLTLTLSQIRATFGHAFKLLQKSFPKARTVHKLSIFHTLCSSENSKVCDNEPCPSVLTLRPFPQNAVSPGVDRGQKKVERLVKYVAWKFCIFLVRPSGVTLLLLFASKQVKIIFSSFRRGKKVNPFTPRKNNNK